MRLAASLCISIAMALAASGIAVASCFDDIDKTASECRRDRLAPVSSKADEAACTQAGLALVTLGGKPFCGKPLDAAGEAACRKDGGNPVAIGKQKFCEIPTPVKPKIPPQKD